MKHRSILVIIGLALFTSSALAQTDIAPSAAEMAEKEKIYSPYVERTAHSSDFAEGVYWGDTHLHTKFSSDSGMIGNRLGPDEAYRFAKGEEVRSSTGQRVRLIRPLDFLVVSDHAENLGLAPYIAEGNPDLLATEYGKRWYDMVKAGQGYEAFTEWGASVFTGDKIKSPAMKRSVWDRQIAAAEAHNDPGRFTALIGYEWTSLNTADVPSNLHRVVIFRDNGSRVAEIVPFSAHDSMDPEDLWKFMADYESKTGGRVLAIPHNGNLSNGLMFSVERLNGRKIDRDYAETRMKWEPLYEVTQIKGDGEAHPFLSPEDEFADYGTWDKADIAGTKQKEDWMLHYEYARTALQVGLQQQQKLGVNVASIRNGHVVNFLMAPAFAVQPALDDLDAVEVARPGVLHGANHEGGRFAAFRPGRQVSTHRHTAVVSDRGYIGTVNIVGLVIPAAKEAHDDPRTGGGVGFFLLHAIEDSLAGIFAGPDGGQPGGQCLVFVRRKGVIAAERFDDVVLVAIR